MMEKCEYICLHGCLDVFKVEIDEFDDVHECPKCGTEFPLRIDNLKGFGEDW